MWEYCCQPIFIVSEPQPLSLTYRQLSAICQQTFVRQLGEKDATIVYLRTYSCTKISLPWTFTAFQVIHIQQGMLHDTTWSQSAKTSTRTTLFSRTTFPTCTATTKGEAKEHFFFDCHTSGLPHAFLLLIHDVSFLGLYWINLLVCILQVSCYFTQTG